MSGSGDSGGDGDRDGEGGNGESVFEFVGVSSGYGEMRVVQPISANLLQGSVLGVLGRNGVGKSTLMKALAGHLPCMEGQIYLDGEPIHNLSADQRRSRRLPQGQGLSYAMQERSVFDGLSVFDNLRMMQQDKSLDVYEPFFDLFPILKSRLRQMAGTLSGGERKILSFVRTMAEGGIVTLLDEPTEGVQAENIDHMRSLILQASQQGRSFIVVEQHLSFVDSIADQLLVMDHGEAVLQGAADTITRADILRHIQV